MPGGNRKLMVEVNGTKLLNECRAYCKEHNTNFAELSREIGHTETYINATCRAGQFPVAEIKLLCQTIGIDMNDYLKNTDNDAASMSIDRKLDYIICMLEDLITRKEKNNGSE